MATTLNVNTHIPCNSNINTLITYFCITTFNPNIKKRCRASNKQKSLDEMTYWTISSRNLNIGTELKYLMKSQIHWYYAYIHTWNLLVIIKPQKELSVSQIFSVKLTNQVGVWRLHRKLKFLRIIKVLSEQNRLVKKIVDYNFHIKIP